MRGSLPPHANVAWVPIGLKVEFDVGPRRDFFEFSGFHPSTITNTEKLNSTRKQRTRSLSVRYTTAIFNIFNLFLLLKKTANQL